MRAHPARLALVVVSALVLASTLAPFELAWIPGEFPGRVREAFVLSDPNLGWKLAGHFLAFFALGTAIEQAYGDRLRFVPAARLAIAAASIGLAVEILQLMQPSRHARLTDWLCNVVAASSAILIFGRWQRLATIRSRLSQGLMRGVPSWPAGVCAATAATWISAALYPAIRLPETPWDRTMALCIGNEPDGSRPWLGGLAFIGVYDRPLTAADIRTLSESSGPAGLNATRASLGLALGYDFERSSGQILHPIGSLAAAEHALSIPAASAQAHAGFPIELAGAAWLTTAGPSHSLTDRLARNGAFAIELWIHPDNATQDGPARIVTLSRGPYARNVTLAQDGADLEFRVRNGINGENGLHRALRARGVLEAAPRHLFANYDHGVSSIHDAKGRCLAAIDLREPGVHLGLGSGAGGRAATAVLLPCLLALPLSVLVRHRSPIIRHASAVGSLLVAALLPPVVALVGIGGPFRFTLAPWFAGGACLVYPVLLRFVTDPAHAVSTVHRAPDR